MFAPWAVCLYNVLCVATFTAAHGERTMADIQRISLDEVILHFEKLEDPRSTINLQHPLISVVVIALFDGSTGRCERTNCDCQVGCFERRVPFGRVELAELDSAKGCLSSRADGAASGCLSSLFCELVEVVACDGGCGDRRGTTRSGGGRQDGTAEPRP